jgi:carboxymethylenebutenolidase
MDQLQRNLSTNALEDYLTGRVDRREFLRRLALIGGGSVVGMSLLGNLACGAAATPTSAPTATPTPSPTDTPTPPSEPGVTVDPNDPRIEAGPVEFSAAAGAMMGYLSRPSQGGPNPAVLVIHENRGLLPHFSDVTRRLALQGYTALAIDLLSRQGGTGAFADPDAAGDALGELTDEQFVEDLNASVEYLQSLPHVRPDRVGAMGFCFGGGMVWLLSVRNSAVRAAVPFYGSAPPLEEVPDLNAAVLGIYAGNDGRINAGVPDLEAALMEHQKQYEFITYPGADHAFFNDTGERYHPEAAEQAWTETLSWFGQHLMS